MAAQAETGGRMTPGMRGVLIVSLTLNILIVGLVAGFLWRHGLPHDARVSAAEMAAGPLTRALSEADRRAIGREMRKALRADGGEGAMMRGRVDALVRDLRAVPFDPARLAETMRAHRSGMQARFEIAQNVLIAHLAAMSDAERAAYADRVEARIRAWRAGHRAARQH